MAGYTKAEYDALYRFRVRRYFGGTPQGESEVFLNYHKFAMVPILAKRWAALQPVLQIQPSDLVCVVGAGFGWGVDALISEAGCTAVGIDISAYVAAEQSNTEETEIRAAITAAGLDPDSGPGAVILAGVYDGNPRSNVIVLNEDMQTNQSRGNIRSALGGWPSVVIFEDLVDEATTDEEITAANNAANLFAGSQRVIWIYNGLPGRSMQSLQALTGSEVINTTASVHLVP